MAWRLYRQTDTPRRALDTPLMTVACHEDLTATDLVGRFLLSGDETVWIDGPLTRAVRSGAICYLDEVVEARKDTTVVVHSLTDHRRMLPIEKTGELLRRAPRLPARDLVQPGLPERAEGPQALDAPALRQPRFRLSGRGAGGDDHRPRERRRRAAPREQLALIGEKVRNLREHGFEEGVSTRLLVYTAQLVAGRHRAAARLRRRDRARGDRRSPRCSSAVADIVDVLLP